MKPTSGTEGFILMEAIVAFAILSLSLVALYKAIGFAYRSEAHSDASRSALIIGESQIALAANGPDAIDGTRNGIAPLGFHWQLIVQPAPLPDSPPSAIGSAPRRVTYVATSRSGTEILRLETIKLVRQSAKKQ